MKKAYIALTLFLGSMLGFVGVAGAAPVVDPEAEVTSLFNTHAPTVVAVVIAVAGFSVTMSVLAAGIRKIRSALSKG